MRWLRYLPVSSKALLVTGIALAGLAGLLTHNYTRSVDARDPGPLAPVAVAAADLAPGHRIQEGDVALVQLPRRVLPAEHLSSIQPALGARVLSAVGTGEILTPTRISRGGPIAAAVPDGLRSVVIPSGLPGGALEPGDRVDVLATHTQGAVFTETVAEQVEVLLVLSPADASQFQTEGSAERVALLVDPGTAEQIAKASATTAVSLAIAGAQ